MNTLNRVSKRLQQWKRLLVCSVTLMLAVAVWAASVSGPNADIYWPGVTANTVNGSARAAIGHSNQVDASASLAVGSSNIIRSYKSMAVGVGNEIAYGPTSNRTSFLAGTNNYAAAPYSFATGYNNRIEANAGAAMGSGIKITTNTTGSVGVGRFNVEDPGNGEPFVFCVGTGGSDTSRSNGLTVYANGDVEIGDPVGDVTLTRAQGDISMGAYSN